MEYILVVIITFISGVVGTMLGGIIGVILGRDSNKVVSLLLSFAGGVMLSVVTFDLMDTSQEVLVGTNLEKYSPYIISLFVILGYLIVWCLNYLIDKMTNKGIIHLNRNHPKTADDLDELIHSDYYKNQSKKREILFIAGLVMMFAIALHNLPEGMVIGASYAKDPNFVNNVFTGTGFLMALIIGLHNIPEGMAVSVPLIIGGTKKTKAVFLTALSGFPTVIGALIGFIIGGIGNLSLVLSLGFASGAMLYVILGELLPESILMFKSKLPALLTFIGIILGFILVKI